MINLPEFVSGYLLITPSPQGLRPLLLEGVKLDFIGEFSSSSWQVFYFHSTKALLREDAIPGGTKDVYTYPILLRTSERRFLFLSVAREVIDHILSDVIPGIANAAIYRVNFKIQGLVEKVASASTDYSLTFVHARTPKYGNQLTTVSFYGESVSDAGLFAGVLDEIRSYSCGLSYAPSGPEILSLRRGGQVSFSVPQEARASQLKKLIDVERILNFMRHGDFIVEPPV